MTVPALAALPASDAAANGYGSIALLTIFVLSIFVGYEVISKVSAVLHTPLMSGANAIHGIVLVGAIIVGGQAQGALELVLAAIAVVLAAINLVGGFVVTDRMLEMFKPRQAPKAVEAKPEDVR
jgi:NAD(P) transhydrogenase subunit alpha